MDHPEYGICRLSVIPTRANPSDQSEMTSQLLFGEHYKVLEVSKDKSWLNIRNYYDDYSGWIDQKQFYPISVEYFEQINHSDYKICLDLTSSILFQKNNIQILMGSILPISSNEIFRMEEKLAFNGEAKSLSQRRDFEFLKTIAVKYLNVPYLWGGRTPFGIDCSGFVQMVFKICGYNLPRDSDQQSEAGNEITFNNSKPGDLAFFGNKTGKISHVGIILEEGKIIHSSGMVRIDEISEEGILNDDINLITHKLLKIKRILQNG